MSELYWKGEWEFSDTFFEQLKKLSEDIEKQVTNFIFCPSCGEKEFEDNQGLCYSCNYGS